MLKSKEMGEIFFSNSKSRQEKTSKVLFLNESFLGKGEKHSSWNLNSSQSGAWGNLTEGFLSAFGKSNETNVSKCLA